MLEIDRFNNEMIDQAKYWTNEIIKGAEIEGKKSSIKKLKLIG